MGNTIFIKDMKVCIKPLKGRLEVIKKLKPPTCYVGQYGLIGYSLKCLGVIILHMIVYTAINICSSSSSLFFPTLRQNN